MFFLFSIIFHCSIFYFHFLKRLKIMSKTLPNSREFALLVPVSLNPTRWAGPGSESLRVRKSSKAALALREGAVLCPEEAEKPSPSPGSPASGNPARRPLVLSVPGSYLPWTAGPSPSEVRLSGLLGQLGNLLPAQATAAQHSPPSHKACLCIPRPGLQGRQPTL